MQQIFVVQLNEFLRVGYPDAFTSESLIKPSILDVEDERVEKSLIVLLR